MPGLPGEEWREVGEEVACGMFPRITLTCMVRISNRKSGEDRGKYGKMVADTYLIPI